MKVRVKHDDSEHQHSTAQHSTTHGPTQHLRRFWKATMKPCNWQSEWKKKRKKKGERKTTTQKRKQSIWCGARVPTILSHVSGRTVKGKEEPVIHSRLLCPPERGENETHELVKTTWHSPTLDGVGFLHSLHRANMQISYSSSSNFRARPRRQHQSCCLTRYQTSPRPSQQSDLLKIWQDIFKECTSAIKARHWLFTKARLLGYAQAGGVYAWIWCLARGRQGSGDCGLLNAVDMFTVFTSSRANLYDFTF